MINQNKIKKNILIIASSDSSGGAGIVADIKTASALGAHPSIAIACLTAQNSKEVRAVFSPPAQFLRAQIDAVFADDDMKIAAIKIGMLGNKKTVEIVAQILKHKKYKSIPIILDPVMIASSGAILLAENAIKSFKEKLIPRSYLITPNIFEAEMLAQIKINNLADMKCAAQKIAALGARNVLIKGGHFEEHKSTIRHLFLNESGEIRIFSNKRINGKNKMRLSQNRFCNNLKTRGTGCALASAIASFLAQDYDLANAIKKANCFVYTALS